MNNEILRIENVSKKYRLGMIGGTTLRDELQRKRALRKGLDDPTRKVNDKSGGHIGEEFLALDGINISVHCGERVGIIGHNGAGKSTLLKLISRITAPSTGYIEMNGRIASMLEVGTGFHPELTGRENIYMNGAILGMSKSEISSKIEDIIEFSECRQFIDTPVKRYSSGMYVKLAFSVAAHLDSEIMIMDEVLAVGDVAFQKKCLEKMSRVSETEGRTILYVSHNMSTIRQLCERVIVLDHGKLVYDGNVEEGVATYIGIQKESEACVDLNPFHHNVSEEKRHVQLQKMSVKHNELWRISAGGKLKFSVTVYGNEDVESVGFRSLITSAEGNPVSVVTAPNLFSIKKGETLEIPLEADISLLVPGKYCLTPSLYAVNPYGGWQFFDHINRAVTFQVTEVEGFNENVPWEKNNWGYIKLPEIRDLRSF